jgi:hypothetical protein
MLTTGFPFAAPSNAGLKVPGPYAVKVAQPGSLGRKPPVGHNFEQEPKHTESSKLLT